MIMMMRTKREEREGLGADGLMNKCSKARVGGGTMHTFVFFSSVNGLPLTALTLCSGLLEGHATAGDGELTSTRPGVNVGRLHSHDYNADAQ